MWSDETGYRLLRDNKRGEPIEIPNTATQGLASREAWTERVCYLQAFHDAWNATCSSEEENPTIIVPGNNTFLVQQVLFSGPCKAKNITFLILGNMIAPDSPESWSRLDPSRWLSFRQVEQLHVTGFGTIDGRGEGMWNQSCRYHPHLAMKFLSCNASSLTNINFINSSQAHILISGSHYFKVDNLLIEAPWNSPNTDGIHIQSSEQITISNTMIRTGDDCVSIGDYTSNIHISSSICGPGHGVSIGSLGRSGNVVQVEDIHHSGVHISNVTYNDLSGTSSTNVAINFNRSRSIACTGIVLKSINLTSAKPRGRVTSSCTNAYGNVIGGVQPKPCLLVAKITA
ncbi:hypothetical protein CRG98_003883 [Punica granatum]|uniref:Uncharacterized protein n=1 Tax=Punica granatum TaxID=22663 RepID=A0A2I0L544_PUNGR|nr:hypothetical protein CRG98_003883 [Punica granatum]